MAYGSETNVVNQCPQPARHGRWSRRARELTLVLDLFIMSSASTELFSNVRPRLMAIGYRMLSSVQEAEDLGKRLGNTG